MCILGCRKKAKWASEYIIANLNKCRGEKYGALIGNEGTQTRLLDRVAQAKGGQSATREGSSQYTDLKGEELMGFKEIKGRQCS